ncbi:hypothetical protein D3C80_1843420 [compost metagenome]
MGGLDGRRFILDQVERTENIVTPPQVFGPAIAGLEQDAPISPPARERADGEPSQGADLAGGQARRQVGR